jgi:predicted lysophospholipase L1 biosynthesis ABC-type transport system permease subunit
MGDEPGMAPPVVGEIFAPAPGPTFRLSRLPASAAATPLPALAGTSFLAATGARVGDTVASSVSGLPVTLEIVGSADAFPPADPAVPFVVVDAPTLAQSRFAANGQVNAPQEWWLATDDGSSGSVADAVAGPPFSAAAVVDRAALERSLTSDPVPLGIIGAFGLGAIAAVLFAAIGFLLSASISTTERLGEFALLRALGLSPRQLAGWVSGESAFLLGFGFIGGALLGAILAWLVLPFSALTSTGERAVPTPAVVVPPEALAVLLVIGLGLLAVTVAVVRRRVLSVSVAGVLRARDT